MASLFQAAFFALSHNCRFIDAILSHRSVRLAQQTKDGAMQRILVVEDESDIRQLLPSTLNAKALPALRDFAQPLRCFRIWLFLT